MILTKEKITQLDIDRLVNDFIEQGKVNELLIVVPTNRKLRNLKKEIISDSPGLSASTINVETITTLSSKLFIIPSFSYNEFPIEEPTFPGTISFPNFQFPLALIPLTFKISKS